MNLQTKEKLFTVTVGIPAYNEEANIAHLIDSILSQNQANFILKKIIVVSDGSTDATEEMVRTSADRYPVVELFVDGGRKGKSARLNQIYDLNMSDVLVTFDADIRLDNTSVMENMVKPLVLDEGIDVVAANSQQVMGATIAEKISWASSRLWYEVRKNFNGGDNIYNSTGAAFALRKSFLESFRFPPETIADQQFVYLGVKRRGNKFCFAEDAAVSYCGPKTLREYFIQSHRFLTENKLVESHFDSTVSTFYVLPCSYKIRAVLKMMLCNPFYTALAIGSQVWLRVFPPREDKLHRKGMWQIVSSTKKHV